MINESNLKRFCCGDFTEIVNYADAVADTTQTWECHHRKGLKYSKDELMEKGWYNKRPPEELIFLTPSEHMSLHMKGIPKTAEHRENISKGKKGTKYTAEHRENLSKAKKGNKNAKGSKGSLGMYWYNNGIENKRAFTCPEGFVKGMLIKKKSS